jgi:hypothetical protein
MDLLNIFDLIRACAISSSDIFTAVGIMMVLFECYGCIILHFNHICNQKFYLALFTNTGFMTMNSPKELSVSRYKRYLSAEEELET